MDNIKAPVEDIIDDIKDYIDTSAELYKLRATEKAAEIVSNAVINLTLALAGAFVMLFVSLALAFMLSEYFHHDYLGFLMVAGLYALLAVFIYMTKDKWLKHRIVNSFIKSIYSRNHEK